MPNAHGNGLGVRHATSLPRIIAMSIRIGRSILAGSLIGAGLCGVVHAESPSPAQALKLVPMQKDAEFDRPTEAENCTIKAEKIGGKTGWVVRSSSGQILRNFVDTNKDNVVDQWSYFKGGIETYRDIDSNFNGKADQSRWLNVGGTRWGIDRNEDGKIDLWKAISAEELTAEIVAAIATQDADRFARLLATPAEIKSLGLDSAKAADLSAKSAAAAGSFAKLAQEKELLSPDSKWVFFGGGKPGTVPPSGDGSNEVTVYEGVTAMVDSSGKVGQVEIGTLIRINDCWRAIDVPNALSGNRGFAFYGANQREEVAAGGTQGPSEEILASLRDLEAIDKSMAKAASPEELGKLNAKRADIVEKLAKDADSPEDRDTWYRDLGDTVLAAVQTGAYPDGVQRLKEVADQLAESEDASNAEAMIRFRLMKAEYYLAQANGENFTEVQNKWLEDLEKFVAAHPQSSDAADAMMELATAYEFSGSDTKAIKWYGEIVKNFPKAASYATAKGAQERLASVGKPIEVAGKLFGSKAATSLARYKNKVVLLHYWSSDVELCRAEIPQLQEMLAKYGKSGFAILSVSLDRDSKDLQAYLAAKKLPWEVIYEPGGINSRLGTEMGIHTLPTMLLIDKQGRVANRSIHAAELDSELRKLLVDEARQATRR
jgi:thiol-disulfide isomerase/thioredoxin